MRNNIKVSKIDNQQTKPKKYKKKTKKKIELKSLDYKRRNI